MDEQTTQTTERTPEQEFFDRIEEYLLERNNLNRNHVVSFEQRGILEYFTYSDNSTFKWDCYLCFKGQYPKIFDITGFNLYYRLPQTKAEKGEWVRMKCSGNEWGEKNRVSNNTDWFRQEKVRFEPHQILIEIGQLVIGIKKLEGKTADELIETGKQAIISTFRRQLTVHQNSYKKTKDMTDQKIDELSVEIRRLDSMTNSSSSTPEPQSEQSGGEKEAS